MKYDYVVIGSGISGLVSGIILSKQGLSVAVLEKAAQPAPLLRGFKRRGIHIDTGFHYTGAFAHGEALDSYFRYLNIAEDLEKIPYDSECFDSFYFTDDDYSFSFPFGYERLRDRLCSAFPHEKKGIDSYLHTVSEEFNRSPHLNLDISSNNIFMYDPYSSQSLNSFLQGLISNPRLRSILSMHYLLYGTEPGRSSVSVHAQVAGSLYSSVHGIKGGGRTLAKTLLQRLRNLDADIFSRSNVAKVMVRAGEFQGVELANGETVQAKGCISSIHPRALLPLVEETAFRPATRQRFQAFEDTTSAFMFSAELEQLPEMLSRKNLFLCPDDDLDTYCHLERAIEKRPFFFASAGLENEKSRPGMIMLCPASMQEMYPWRDSLPEHRPESYLEMKQALMQRVHDHVLRKVPAIHSLTMLDCATPLTFRDYANAPSGCLYGIKQKYGQLNPTPLSKIRGLYLTGQALTAPGILGGTISAFLTCGVILGQQKLIQEVRKCR